MNSALDRFERSLVAAADRLAEHQSSEPVERPAKYPRPRRRFSRRGLLLAFLGSAVLAGGAATAATLLGPTQRLADGHIRCYAGTTPHSNLTGGMSANGQDPTAVCRRMYRLNAHTNINATTLGFIACRATATMVAVYVADQRAGQCRAVGEKSLPANFKPALARLHALESGLTRLQRQANCPSVPELARESRAVLLKLGFDDWRIALPALHPQPRQSDSPAGTGGGPCGSLLGNPSVNSPSAAVTVAPYHRTIYVQAALPRSTDLRIYRVQGRLYGRTYDQCFTADSVRALIKRSLHGTGMQPRYATTNAGDGIRFEPASQQLYDQGCTRFNTAYPANNGRFIDIWLFARHAPPLSPRRLFPPASAFTRH